MKIKVFTDGACSNNGKKGAKASYAYWFPDHKELSHAEIVPEDQMQTNQRGELLAISEAVKKVETNFPANEIDLHIYTDSTYCKNCLTSWLPTWIRTDWKNSKGAPVAHRDLIEDTSVRLSKFNSYVITYIAAHTGKEDEDSKNNDIVDKMAVRVLTPEEEVKIVTTNKQVAIEGLPIFLMGPPVSEHVLLNWCFDNLDKLDQSLLNAAVIGTLSKTLKKNGFDLSKQRLHRSNMYRLSSANHLIAEPAVIKKEE